MNIDIELEISSTSAKSSPSSPSPIKGIGQRIIRGGAIGIRLVNDTKINEAKPRNKHAAMNKAEKKIQFDKASLNESNFNEYGRISARLISSPQNAPIFPGWDNHNGKREKRRDNEVPNNNSCCGALSSETWSDHLLGTSITLRERVEVFNPPSHDS